ncbi:MAG: PHP domain-containing protein [Lentisphaerae bacterium]|nr:PHP domain-containing protein [Lentisphaerota bacterium]
MIDLHLHSTFSDGNLTPEELIAEAERLGLSAVALTDHDCIGGLERFIRAASGKRVKAVTGVEISVDFKPGTMHMLGYCFDPLDAELRKKLDFLVEGRNARNRDMLATLNQIGISLTLEEVKAFVGEGTVGRLHFALALQKKGYVRTTEEAFDRYLGKGKQAYAERDRLTPAMGIAMIRNAGGVAVLSHPFTLEISREQLTQVVAGLVESGLQGIEIYYPQHQPKQLQQYLALAKQFNLLATGGTDYHGTAIPGLAMGTGFGSLNVPDEVLTRIEALAGDRPRPSG